MNYNTPCDPAGWSQTGCVFDMDSLAAYFERLQDQRRPRGKRYRLAQICILATLAKLSGEDHVKGICNVMHGPICYNGVKLVRRG